MTFVLPKNMHFSVTIILMLSVLVACTLFSLVVLQQLFSNEIPEYQQAVHTSGSDNTIPVQTSSPQLSSLRDDEIESSLVAVSEELLDTLSTVVTNDEQDVSHTSNSEITIPETVREEFILVTATELVPGTTIQEQPSWSTDSEGYRWANLLGNGTLTSDPPPHSQNAPNCTIRMPHDVYVVNLPGERGAARRREISDKFDKAGIQFMLVAPHSEGEDNWTPQNHQEQLLELTKFRKAPKYIRAKLKKIRTFGEYSVAVTHNNIYHDMLQRQKVCALIFEDDAAIEPHSFMTLFRKVLGRLPNDYGFLKIGYGRVSFKWRTTNPLKAKLKIKQGHRKVCCTDGYLISARGAWVSATMNTPVWMRADHVHYPEFRDKLGMCAEVGGCNATSNYVGTYIVRPHLVIQNKTMAHVGTWRTFDDDEES